MLYFIPAWYKENIWCEDELIWYQKRLNSEFDETIKQISLVHRNMKVPYCILLLNYAPNFRHFLHRQGMFRANYWSLFDGILQINTKKVVPFSYHNFPWPKGIEFVYSPFAVVGYLNGVKYAQIEFGEDGNPISIAIYIDNCIHQMNYFDDRGFVTSRIYYENNKPMMQEYLMEDGTWKLRHNFNLGVVTINPKIPYYSIECSNEQRVFEFKKLEYYSMNEVIEEVLANYISYTSDKDSFFVAVHPLHIEILEKTLKNRNIIATFFKNRFDYSRLKEIEEFLAMSSYLITDSDFTTQLIRKNAAVENNKIMDISPYDTRVDFGISQQLKVQNILVPVDGILEEAFEKIVVELCKYIDTNEKAMVYFFSRSGNSNFINDYTNKILRIIEDNQFDKRLLLGSEMIAEDNVESDSENINTSELKRLYLNQYIDERTLSKCIHEQRVILDLTKSVDVFLDITAISKGVPRISLISDQFVEHKKNGYIISSTNEISAGLSFYLNSMENWNEALVACYEMAKNYTTKVLIESWRKVLDSFEQD